MAINHWAYKSAANMRRSFPPSESTETMQLPMLTDRDLRLASPEWEHWWMQVLSFSPGEQAGVHYPSQWNADMRLLQLAYLIVRASKPQFVVETGVANGLTTWAVLQALEHNSYGQLYSVDPCRIESRGGETGYLVPRSLRHRWTLLPGRSKRELPQLLDRIGAPDVFVHDSLHTYRNVLFELTEVLRRDSPGRRFVIADDVEANTAFVDAFARTTWTIQFIPHATKSGLVGLGWV